MGFWANMAAKSEMKTREQVLDYVREFSSEIEIEVEYGNVLLPCHIIPEAHNGFFLEFQDTRIGVFRCQNHWWLYELDPESLNGLRSPESEKWMKKVGTSQPVDAGGMEHGIPAFVASILMMLQEVSSFGNEDHVEDHRESYLQGSEFPRVQKTNVEIVGTVSEAIGLLWQSGSNMKIVEVTKHFPHDYTSNRIVFFLQFDSFRPESPLVLAANLSSNRWELADPKLEKSQNASLEEDFSSPTSTALNIFQLITNHGLMNSRNSAEQASWMSYLDENFVHPVFTGFLAQLTSSTNPQYRAHSMFVTDSILRGYKEYPVPNSALNHVIELLNSLDDD